ncbi:MAG: 16S rRNA (cytidine(1402)-2'-O)-methyltransferase [Bacteroidota bacterium]
MARISLVPTPVGNLEDMSFRAVRILKEADLIAAEDTRTSGILLKHYEIDTPKLSLHQHNEHSKVPQLLERLENEDLHLALVSDAGTPGISDPGFLLVREAVARGIVVETLPGATAFVPALVSSGIPCDRFVFEGFLPVKKGRQTRFNSLVEESRTMVFYESPHRIEKTIRQMAEFFGEERQVCISRELSKLHEEHIRGSLAEVLENISKRSLKGEIVIVLAGKP